MDDLKQLMRTNYLEYASYVILERAIPKSIDGLKPVQRRILQMLWKMHDGKLHKVANVVGQTMALHPHGDAPIYDALVNLANKGYLLDCQGNFGNIYTGDPAAAARYIETRLSPLAKETLFNPALTETIPSYDGRGQEPVNLPAKIPLLLMQGAEGIAVGMSTKILPHNFVELLEAEIAILQKKPYEILPDFPTGGMMDASDYRQGRGKVKLRAKIEEVNDKTLVIREICYGTTTESLTRSIDDAAKKGKLRIDSINDYTAEKVEIEIKLPRGHYAKDLVDQLYAFTDCEVSLSPQMTVIRNNLPHVSTVNEVLEEHAYSLKDYLKRELELEREELMEKVFNKSLEQIFIEKKIYKKIEELKTAEAIDEAVAKGLQPYHKQLLRIPTKEDRDRLLAIPIRRISRFDRARNEEEIAALEERIEECEKHLRNLTRFTTNYIRSLIKKYGKDYARKTEISAIEELDKAALATKKLKVGVDLKQGFIGTKIRADIMLECTNRDKLLMMFDDGSYRVINVPEKQFVLDGGKKLVYASVADKKTVMTAIYKDPKSKLVMGKRFVVSKFILDKEYSFMEEGMNLEFLTAEGSLFVELNFVAKARMSQKKLRVPAEDIPLKGVSAKGKRLSQKEVRKVKILQVQKGQEADDDEEEDLFKRKKKAGKKR